MKWFASVSPSFQSALGDEQEMNYWTRLTRSLEACARDNTVLSLGWMGLQNAMSWYGGGVRGLWGGGTHEAS
jgi:hypothetical protein